MPPAPRVVRTGTTTLAGLEVAIWNGTPDPSPLIRWGVERFVDAGLTPPIPTSVTFLPPGQDPWGQYGFAEGSPAPDLALAFPAAEACGNPDCTQWPGWAKAAMLHQLAHQWLWTRTYAGLGTASRLGPSQATSFLRAHGLEWADPAKPWALQGSQRAAETLAWGLMDEPYSVDARLGPLTCAQLSADFALLARAPADPRACAERIADSGAAKASSESGARFPRAAPPPWVPTEDAHAAVTWLDTYASAMRQGLANIPAFYAEDARVDHRAVNAGITSGRDSVLDLMGTQEEGRLLERQRVTPLYLGAGEAVSVDRITSHVGAGVGAFAMSMGPSGIRRESYAPSLQSWRRTLPRDERLLRAQLAIEGYRQAWSGGSPEQAAALYAEAAILTDDLLGIHALGRTDIAQVAGAPPDRGGLPGLSWVELPDMGGPGIFFAGGRTRNDQLDTAVLLARTEGCAQRSAIVLRLDIAGHIQEETRLHNVSDLSLCPGLKAATAWWDRVAVPPAVAVVHTGTLQEGDRAVQVYNGSPALEQLVMWGFARYGEAGLGIPPVDKVTFLSATTDACRHVAGLALGTEITLCVDTTSQSQLVMKATLLHELGHAWMTQAMDQADRERFTRASGKPTWASTSSPWGDRGVELAASTLSWALMDQPQPLSRKLGTHSCTELAALYRSLVGKAPAAVPPCPYGTTSAPAA